MSRQRVDFESFNKEAVFNQRAIQQQYIYRSKTMFEQYSRVESFSSSRSLDCGLTTKESSSFDLQYEICSKYMKMTSEQLYQKEIELMQTTNKLIEKFNENYALKDISSTQQSLTLEPFLEQQDPFTQPSRSRLLLRKSQSNSSIRRTESSMTEALRELQKKCSQKTYSMISSMANDYRRLKEKMTGNEKMEKDFKKLETKYSAIQQQLLLLKKRFGDLQNQNKSYLEETLTLKKKLKESSQQAKKTTLSMSKSSGNLLTFGNSSSYERLKKFLEQKEVHVFKKEKEVRSIQDKIQRAISSIIDEESCEKCCQMVKRIKQSIMKYRTCLQEESKTADTLYSKYKELFAC